LNFADYIFWSLRHCRKRLFESGLIVLAIGLGVGVVISVLALFDGVRIQQETYLKQEQYRTISVRTVEDMRAVFSEAAGPLIAVPEIVAEPIVFGIQDIRDLKAVISQAYVYAERSGVYPTSLLSSENQQQGGNAWAGYNANRISVTALTPDYFGFHELVAEKGTLFMEVDVDQASKVIVLGYSLAQRLFGDENPIGKKVPLGADNQPYTVVGVLKEIPVPEGDWQAQMTGRYNDQGFIPLTAQPSMFSRNSAGNAFGNALMGAAGMMGVTTVSTVSLNEIRVGMSSGRHMGSILRQTREYMYQTYGDTISVYSSYEAFQQQQQRYLFMGAVVGLFSSLGLVIAAINILNLMLARIYRRIRSIGIAISIGANRKTVFQQFLIEAALLGIIGAVVGLGLSYGGVRLITTVVGEPVEQTLRAQIYGIGAALIISLLFGVYPALQASRINPVDALRVD
jgi:putative ABC transport system permease protein